eukprot:COSAG01_NODE_12508_length_1727_cov_8.904791_3_plen_156_part_00
MCAAAALRCMLLRCMASLAAAAGLEGRLGSLSARARVQHARLVRRRLIMAVAASCGVVFWDKPLSGGDEEAKDKLISATRMIENPSEKPGDDTPTGRTTPFSFSVHLIIPETGNYKERAEDVYYIPKAVPPRPGGGRWLVGGGWRLGQKNAIRTC